MAAWGAGGVAIGLRDVLRVTHPHLDVELAAAVDEHAGVNLVARGHILVQAQLLLRVDLRKRAAAAAARSA